MMRYFYRRLFISKYSYFKVTHIFEWDVDKIAYNIKLN